MQAFSPALPAPQSLYYSAGEAHSLETLQEKSLCDMVEDIKVTHSDKEHYITGWMGADSVVVIHNYHEKRGTSNGFVLTKENQYRLSVQSIAFRIPKLILWLSFRRNPRTMMLITYNTLGELVSPLMQYRNMTDKPVKLKLEQDWQALNDYIGMACWQLENGSPLWGQLQQALTPDALAGYVNAPVFSEKRLQKDGEFEGFWAGNVFIARCLGPYPALQLLWRDEDNQMQPGYIYTAVPETRGGVLLPSLRIRPHRGDKSYLLNAFDAQHLHHARSLLSFAQGILTGMSPPLVEMMDRPDTLTDL
ncbi:hypothetical protein [Acerihabitans arboris]|uniref:Uncharacterized protein n=1 Tax=Acerihabitans arboris TaxID=2691583 RepID=A0A845SWU9_9GAMM|nr:hypothetical protein [Acerihabitans arboris]NDL65365.1 hypothetical protein [Acerihabitans arboris]